MALPSTNQQILSDLELSLLQVQEFESSVRAEAFKKGVSPMMMRYSDGTSVMMPLLVIKVQCLSTIYHIRKDLEAQDAKGGE